MRKKIGGWVLATSGLAAGACGPYGEDAAPERGLFELAAALEYSADPLPGGTLEPTSIPKYETALVVPPVMPRTGKVVARGSKNIDYYEIAVREFEQEILPASMGRATRVWSYGNAADPTPGPGVMGSSFHYPAFTVEAKWEKPVRVKWLNELVKDPDDCFHNPAGEPKDPGSCGYLPHLLRVDQTLHWANPPGECRMGPERPDCAGVSEAPYTGPVPIVTHVHGAHTSEESDGYPEAWVLPAANDIPASVRYTHGSFYERFKASFESRWGTNPRSEWTPGSSVYQYPNDMLATTLWYHDHALGMTRLNVYAGPAGFYLLRGGPGDEVKQQGGGAAVLPGPAPEHGDPTGIVYREIPIAIQDRSFNDDGSLFYPAHREHFEGLRAGELASLGVEFTGLDAPMSDVAPAWNPEFFGNAIVVNGRTWPYLDVEPRRYRLRLLNGSQSRFLVLRLVAATDPDDPDTRRAVGGAITQIGAEGGFLPAPIPLDELLLGPAERADVIVDFARVALEPGEGLYLVNLGPDEPFGGGVPGVDFAIAHPGTTGQVMKFNLLPLSGHDGTTPPDKLLLPRRAPLPEADGVRRLSLNELMSMSQTLCVDEATETALPVTERPCPDGVVTSLCSDGSGAYLTVPGDVCADPAYPLKVLVSAEPFGPAAAQLGTLHPDGTPNALPWHAAISETPRRGDTETWELYNFTADAHPIHVHLVQFEVSERQLLALDEEGMAMQPALPCTSAASHPTCAAPERGPLYRGPEPWETGLKDTVIAYPGEVTRIKARFDVPGLFVWHCHILEHEDNEMMRPYCVTAPDGTSPAACMAAGMEHAH